MPSFPLEVRLDGRFGSDATPPARGPISTGDPLPEPVFPQQPELLNDGPWPGDGQRRWSASEIYRAFRGWAVPFFQSRVLPGDFHPIIAYLFTEYRCNLDCYYCYSFDNRVKGMTEQVARASIDWLHDGTCRVLALMGGEVILRPAFVHKVVYYAAKKGFWIYIPTNGRLLKPELINQLGDAGVGTFNVAVDVVDEKPGLPKALAPIRPAFEYLLKKRYRYQYSVFFNINICRNNLDDVRALTEIAHEYQIATDYHLNEAPLVEQPHFKHGFDNPTYFRPEDYERVDGLIEWLIDRQKAGYPMANSVARLAEMKRFVRGAHHDPWNCRAGMNTLIIRVDGTLAPCFPMYSAPYNWGVVGAHNFDRRQLAEMKRVCEPNCFSTLNHIVGWCYNDARVVKWLARQAVHGFQGIHGNFE